MNRLNIVDDGGAKYYVSAPDAEAAMQLVRAVPDFDADPDEPLECRTIERTDDPEWAATYTGQDGDSCPMRLAFELCREHAQIIACSEWS